MALRKIRLSDDPLLRKKSRPIKTITDNIKVLFADMLETMHANDGVGLAAPQVGVLKRLIVVSIESEVYELVNPEIIESSGEVTNSEGCLSVPGKTGFVTRPTYLKVKALNKDGEEVIIEAKELLAVALCHEIDHLDGILYIDKLVEVEEEYEEDFEEEDFEEEYE